MSSVIVTSVLASFQEMFVRKSAKSNRLWRNNGHHSIFWIDIIRLSHIHHSVSSEEEEEKGGDDDDQNNYGNYNDDNDDGDNVYDDDKDDHNGDGDGYSERTGSSFHWFLLIFK